MKETIEILENFDVNLFKLINEANGPVMDQVMFWVSVKWVWIPLYLLMIYLLFRQYGWKGALVIVGCAGVLVGLTDLISVHGFKEVVQRFRPCHNTEFGHLVHLIDENCGGQFGFVSSHAANSFAIAYFIGRMGKDKYGGLMVVLMIWACVIGYSRIYLGVHYPSDVIVGALLGVVLAIGMIFLCRLLLRKFRVFT